MWRWFFALAVLTVGLPAGALESWDRTRIRTDLEAGRPLVVRVIVALCHNDQVDCGSQAAGAPGNLKTNLYWGAIFGARRFLERKGSAFQRVFLAPGPDGVLERAVYRRKVPAKRWGLARTEPIEQLVVLDAVHGNAIDRAVTGFWRTATEGDTVEFLDAGKSRRLGVHVAGYVGHNRLMDGTRLPAAPRSAKQAIPSFVLACYSESYFSAALTRAGSKPLVMTRALMAPEGYVLNAVLLGIGDGQSEQVARARAVAAYAKWQKLSNGVASRIFAPR
ncbi:MAG: hypothetical protein R3B13_03625 [Polyangiaceae bacterium]